VSYILAIESDPRQAAALSHVVKDRVSGAQLTVVDSKDGAIASIKKKAPDLILVTALFSPREEEELIAHLRTLEGAEHLQTLTIPLLAASDATDGKSKRGLFGFRKKKTEDVPTQGCDPVVFAEQIAGYLKTAADLKANAEAAKIAAERTARRAAETAAETAAEPPVEPSVEMVGEAPGEPVFVAAPEPIVAYEPEPVVAQAYEPVVQAPEPIVSNAPEPVVAKAPEQPLIANPTPEPEPETEPQIFGSVLFAKVKPKRVIKPFVESAPVVDEPRVIPDLPIIDEAPAVTETPVVLAPPVVNPAPPPTPPVEETRVFQAAPVVEEPPLILEVPPVVEQYKTDVPLPVAQTPASFSMPEPPPPAPEPPRPVRLVQRLPPLAMWARRLQEAEASHANGNGDSSNGSDEGPMGVLRIPPAIATISYPTGCRIRRVIAKQLS
jgi:hypothetical protein